MIKTVYSEEKLKEMKDKFEQIYLKKQAQQTEGDQTGTFFKKSHIELIKQAKSLRETDPDKANELLNSLLFKALDKNKTFDISACRRIVRRATRLDIDKQEEKVELPNNTEEGTVSNSTKTDIVKPTSPTQDDSLAMLVDKVAEINSYVVSSSEKIDTNIKKINNQI